MKKQFIVTIYCLLAVMAFLASCKKEIGSLNGSTIEDLSANATKFQLNNVVIGTESGMRNSLDFYLDVVGMIGREMYTCSACAMARAGIATASKNAASDVSRAYSSACSVASSGLCASSR